jgi:hypothetical protein
LCGSDGGPWLAIANRETHPRRISFGPAKRSNDCMSLIHIPLLIEIGIIGLLVLLLIGAVWLAKRDQKRSSTRINHIPPISGEISGRQIPSLLTPPELACFNTLHMVAGKEYHVMAKVSLSDIAVVKQGVDKTLMERVAKKGLRDVDFILCSKDNLAVVCAIELGEASGHRDFTLGDFLHELGILYFRLPVKTSYSMPEIRGMLEPILKERPPTPDEMVATVSMEAFRACKTCKSRMVLKRAKSGKYKGVLFWVCSRYPECKTIELFTR